MATVFVRNLPYGVTQEELEQIFGDVGPVKKVDVIKDKGKRKSEMLTRGFAFVRYAIESDAQYAVEKLHNHEFQGRRMRLEIAHFIPLEEPVAPTEAKKPKKDKTQKKKEAKGAAPAAAEEQAEAQEAEAPKKEKKEKKEKKKKHRKQEADGAEEQQEDADADTAKGASVAATQAKPSKQQPQAQAPPATTNAPTGSATQKPPAIVGGGPNFAAAEPKVGPDGRVQSERNARRRMHREFLRQVEQRKEDTASAQEKTVVVFGLGAAVTLKHLAKKVKKIGKASTVELKEEEKTGKKFAVVAFEKLADADAAVRKLDHHIFKGAMLKVARLSENSGGGSGGAKESEGLRLIVRNLHFDTTDSDLERAFEAHGPLFEARVVRMPVEDPDNAAPDAVGRSRGFGFVQFRDVADARAAVAALNGVKVRGREMVVDFALAKAKYVEQQRSAKSMEVNPDEEEDDDDEEGADDSGEGHDDELEMASDDEGSDDDDDDDDDDENADENNNDDDDDDHDDAIKSGEPKSDTDAQRYRTLFLRNLSFQTSEEGLKAFFATFGAVEYARVVYDHGSGLSKGVGFVRFKDAAVADSVLARGQLAEEPTPSSGRKQKQKKKKENAFTLSALADGDALVLDGRMLSLTRAVAKADAERLAAENSSARKQKDKRNMYLAYEGTINVNKLSAEELALPAMDVEKRRRAIREKKEKLKNPLYFVSPVRLSVRNLSAAVDDKKLKEVFRDGAAAGVREGVVDRAEVKTELLPKRAAAPVKVKMAKVVRDTEAAKAAGGVGAAGASKEPRSRGYGFVEFAEHVHALAALRKLNNNPAFAHLAAGAKADKKGGALAESARSRLIVEFALENHGKLKLREKRRADADKRRAEERALREAQGLPGGAGAASEKRSRGQRQREAKKARALPTEDDDDGKGDTAAKPTKLKPTTTTTTTGVSAKRKRGEGPEAAGGAAAKKQKQKTQKAAVVALSRKERKQATELAAEESFDALVRNYKREIFGDKKPAAKGDAAEPRERWFD
ncbi:hypothetical protein PybrP1_004436 [[Pythium] brassicae (nom. inval.)]|nr:hypothetical protein PybrP1_004436 [[Pythium] brassicae (nom. inval.)]